MVGGEAVDSLDAVDWTGFVDLEFGSSVREEILDENEKPPSGLGEEEMTTLGSGAMGSGGLAAKLNPENGFFAAGPSDVSADRLAEGAKVWSTRNGDGTE